MPLARLFAGLGVRLLDIAVPRLRRVATDNLRLAMPGEDVHVITDGVFRSIARLLLAFARFPDINKENVHRWIRVEGLEHYLEARRRGRGVLIATGHIGNWEFSAFAHALLTEPMNVVVRPLDHSAVDALVERYRQMSGNRIIEKKDAARAILRALQANEAVGILVDQNTTPGEGTFVPFFGRPACAGTAFARLANRTDATVIPGYAVWNSDERRYVLHFETPVEMTGDEFADTAAIHARLEQIIRKYPDQWLWIHRRWKTQPPSAAATSG